MTLLTLWESVLRKLTPAEVDANFKALRTTADGAATALGGFSASQTPGANQIPVVKADKSLVLSGSLYAGANQAAPIAVLATNTTDYVGAISAYFSATGSSGAVEVGVTPLSGNAVGYGGAAAGYLRSSAAASGGIFISATNGGIRFANSSIERMRITPTGNVLINTPTDNASGAKLQVAGDVSVTGNISGLVSSAVLAWGPVSNGDYIQGSANSYINFRLGNVQVLRLNAGGAIQVTGGISAVLPVYADNTAAAALAVGVMYRTATGQVMIKY